MEQEKVQQVRNVELFREAHRDEGEPRPAELQRVARERKNTFEALMKAGKACSYSKNVQLGRHLLVWLTGTRSRD